MKAEHEFTPKTWEECEGQLLELLETYTKGRQRIAFRGQADARWELRSTLERRFKTNLRVAQYFGLIRKIKSELEALTSTQWDFPQRLAQEGKIDSKDNTELSILFRRSYPYLAHLRHHGFPSPLLDWTRSIYVAAYFSFAKPPPEADHVAIFAFSEMPSRGKDGSSRHAKIEELGPV